MARQQTLGVYCVDTSSLVNLRRWRPAKRYPEPWKKLDELIARHRLIAPDEVLHELHGVDDPLLKWARARKKSMFRRSSSDIVHRVQEILSKFPTLIDPNQPGTSADPFVLALALKEKSAGGFFQSGVTVITDEKYAPGRPRIPHVCEAYGLRYLTIHQMFLFEGWSF